MRVRETAIPSYLDVGADQLGERTPVVVRTVRDAAALAAALATAMLEAIRHAASEGRAATLIVPVGPVDQYPILAHRLNEDRIDCRDVCFVNMDEYLDDGGRWIDEDHPLSFRGYMDRAFYSRLDPERAPRPENRVFPDPARSGEVTELITRRGGVDVCFGGIGINGHIAFNEPEPDMTAEAFAALPTRIVDLTPETRTINSVTVGGELGVVPRRAITVGMRECLGARRVSLWCNRPWQSAVVRRVLHGPITATCPASLIRTHDNAEIIVTELVAAKPDVRLR